MDLKRSPRSVVAIAAALAIIAGAWTTPALALIHQQIIVQFDPTPQDSFNNDETRDADVIDDSGGPIVDSILATIVGDQFAATGSVGPFGDLGVEGSTTRTGELDTQVFISADGFQNVSGRPQAAEARFIIDGGTFFMVAGQDSLIEFTLTVLKDLDVVYQTAFDYRSLDNSGSNNELTLFGVDIDATEINASTVEIPLNFETADLGIIQPNETFEISYQLDITATTEVFSELTFFEFSDPLSVDGFDGFVTVEFSAVPLPAGAPLLLSACAGLGLLGCRRTGRAAGGGTLDRTGD